MAVSVISHCPIPAPTLTSNPEDSRRNRPRLSSPTTTRRYAAFSLLSLTRPLLTQSQCYLCPGNKRAQGDSNPYYQNTFAFINDYSAVKEEQQAYEPAVSSDDVSSLLLRAQPVTGRCYVLTFSDKHNVTLAGMTAPEILPVIQTWTRFYASHLSPTHPLRAQAIRVLESIPANPDGEVDPPARQLRYMQIFENKGAAMGCSNPHPHCQIWTTSALPEEPAKEQVQLAQYRAEHGRHMLADYAKLEMEKGERVVWQNEGFLVVCPWWAVWPFEVLIIAKRHVRALVDLTDDERLQLAKAIQEVTRRYDDLFETSFPYSTPCPPVYVEGDGGVAVLIFFWQALESTRRRWTVWRRRPRQVGFTCTSTRRSSGRRRSGSSSSDTRCWPSPSATSRQNRQPPGFETAEASSSARLETKGDAVKDSTVGIGTCTRHPAHRLSISRVPPATLCQPTVPDQNHCT
jgi:galactose-1-phosphate uridylyltransferase (family 1)